MLGGVAANWTTVKRIIVTRSKLGKFVKNKCAKITKNNKIVTH